MPGGEGARSSETEQFTKSARQLFGSVTVYTTSPRVFRKQIILESIPPIQNAGPFCSTHLLLIFSVLFVFCHESPQSVYVVYARAYACVHVCVCVLCIFPSPDRLHYPQVTQNLNL